MSPDAPAHPGVRFPPPFLYLLPFLGGLALHHWWPIDALRVAPEVLRISGILLGITALTLMFSALATFVRNRTSIAPIRPASTLVRTGPYRLTRNPMYLGLAILYCSLAVLLNRAWPLLFLPLSVLLIDRLVIIREERYLGRAFGDDYERYRREVRRWL